MTKKSFEGGVQIAWDATSLDLASACMRKYYYKMIRNLKKKGNSVHLLFGGIYAKCLEEFYKFRAYGDDIDTALQKVIRIALESSWDYERGVPMTFDDARKTRVNLIRTIVWYIEEYGNETEDGLVTYHLQDGKPAVELSFRIDLTDDIVYCGHLDRVASMGGDLYVTDQKTTGSTLSSYYFGFFNPSNQMTGYTFAGQMILHSPVRGVIIDAAQIQVGGTEFGRGITTRSKDQIEEWLKDTRESIYRFQEMTAAESFPMNPTACGMYGGCEFRELCSRSPGVRENYIRGDYEEHVWDPIQNR